jgi:hypothetical protein
MLAGITIPLADLRAFAGMREPASGRPKWPDPDPNEEFLRFFGGIFQRPQGGLTGWVGEATVCEAKRAIRFCQRQLSLPISGDNVRIKVAYRRFWFDGLVVAKFDIGVSVLTNGPLSLDGPSTLRLIRELLELEIRHPRYSQQVSLPLSKAGDIIRLLYALSIEPKNPNLPNEIPPWIQVGPPVLIIALEAGESLPTQDFWHEVPLNSPAEVQLKFARITVERRMRVPTWLVRPKLSSHRMKARQIRIALSRLHTEQQCLRLVARTLTDRKLRLEPESRGAEYLERYVTDVAAKIDNDTRSVSGIIRNDAIEAAKIATEMSSPGQSSQIFSSFKAFNIHAETIEKVIATRPLEVYVENMVNTGGGNYIHTGDIKADRSVVNLSSTISGTVALFERRGETETAKALSEIAKEVEKSGDKKAAEMLTAFSYELETPEPRKSVLQSLWSGLVGALPTIASLAEATAQITKLFTG